MKYEVCNEHFLFHNFPANGKRRKQKEGRQHHETQLNRKGRECDETSLKRKGHFPLFDKLQMQIHEFHPHRAPGEDNLLNIHLIQI